MLFFLDGWMMVLIRLIDVIFLRMNFLTGRCTPKKNDDDGGLSADFVF